MTALKYRAAVRHSEETKFYINEVDFVQTIHGTIKIWGTSMNYTTKHPFSEALSEKNYSSLYKSQCLH